MERGENDVFPFPSPSKGNQAWNNPRDTELGTFHWPPNKMLPCCLQALDSFQRPLSMEHSEGHQAWNLPLATKLGFFFASFLLLLFKGANLDHLSFYF